MTGSGANRKMYKKELSQDEMDLREGLAALNEGDIEKAKGCLEQAAASDNIRAIYTLGDLYYQSRSEEDKRYARTLYNKAFDFTLKLHDIDSRPDVFLRMLFYCSEDLDLKFQMGEIEMDLVEIGQQCVSDLLVRIEDGDDSSHEQLEEVEEILYQLEKFEAGVMVKIRSKNQYGRVQDVRIDDGKVLFLINCYGEIESTDPKDLLVETEASDLDRVY